MPELLRGHRPAEQESLRLVASAGAQELNLCACLDALRKHAQTETLGEANDRSDDGPAVLFGLDVANEGLIDLEFADVKAVQVGKAREPVPKSSMANSTFISRNAAMLAAVASPSVISTLSVTSSCK